MNAPGDCSAQCSHQQGALACGGVRLPDAARGAHRDGDRCDAEKQEPQEPQLRECLKAETVGLSDVFRAGALAVISDLVAARSRSAHRLRLPDVDRYPPVVVTNSATCKQA